MKHIRVTHLIFRWQGSDHSKRIHCQPSLLLNLSWISHFDVKNVINKAQSTCEVDINYRDAWLDPERPTLKCFKIDKARVVMLPESDRIVRYDTKSHDVSCVVK